jgi:predicted DNA-binding transcriptional regulator AlpA
MFLFKRSRRHPVAPDLPTPEPNDDPILIDAEGLAKILMVTVRHVRRMDAGGDLPAPIRLGRLVRWRRDEILKWLAADCPDRMKWKVMRRK